MAFWNRRKKRQQQEEEALEKQAREKLDELREKKKAGSSGREALAQEKQDLQRREKREKYQTELVKPVDENSRKQYVAECCQSIQEADRQIAGIRKEYQEVTDSLLDIQKIDRAEGEEKKSLLHAARNIVSLSKERNQYKNRKLTISELVMRRFEPYENDLVDEIKKMYAAEAYQKAIDGDIEKLQEEKTKLRKEEREVVEKQNALKAMAKVLIVLILSLFILFVVIYYALGVDMTFPYLGTILLAAVSATVIFVESNRNRRDITLAGRKLDKAAGLLNRVKIKCVNNLNLLEYSREKFGVASAKEFEHLWNEYVRAKEYERKFRENTEQLNYYCDSLLELLKGMGLKDCNIWIGQVLAIADSREMVEIRHKLNTQRQLLRERIEYNETVKQDFLKNIDELIQEHPENKEELIKIVESYSEA
jgi:hypothetical protein